MQNMRLSVGGENIFVFHLGTLRKRRRGNFTLHKTSEIQYSKCYKTIFFLFSCAFIEIRKTKRVWRPFKGLESFVVYVANNS